MVLAVVSVSLASLAALAAEGSDAVAVASVVEDAAVVEAVDVAEAVAAATVVKIEYVNPCRSLCRGFLCSSKIRHKGQIAVHTMIMTVN